MARPRRACGCIVLLAFFCRASYDQEMLDKLSKEERLQLMRFICSFAWADLQVERGEIGFLQSMAERLKLSPDEMDQVQSWVEVPPRPEEVDPNQVPLAHRRLFIDAARAMVLSDGNVSESEAENIALLEELLLG